MKRITAVILATLMCLSLLAACGGTPANQPNPGTSSTQQNTNTPNSGNDVWKPSKSVTVIVPWSAGGGSDIAVRTLQPYLEDELGVSLTVVNTTGGNGWIAWSELLAAKPDGYTIAQMNIPTIYSCYLDPQQQRSENLDSFMWVANEVSDWGCMVVKAGDTRFSDVESFISYGMENELLAADNGVGTNKHLLSENLMSQIPGLKLTEVHQSGWSDSYAALLGGHVDVGWASVGECLQAYHDGELDILCVFATDRSSLLPDIPTFNEVMPQYNITSPSDRGFCLPAGTDQAVYDRWVDAMDKCINNPEFIQKMADLGQAVNYIGGEDFYNYAKEQEGEFAKFADILGWT